MTSHVDRATPDPTNRTERPGIYHGPVSDQDLPEEAPIGDNERDALRQDLVDVEALKELLGSKGIKGAVFYCPDCDEDHYLAWDLLKGNLEELLDAGESPVHEPAFDPDPDEYVGWDYARGFLDGYESFAQEELADVADRVSDMLGARGWTPSEIQGFLREAEIEPIDPSGEGRR